MIEKTSYIGTLLKSFQLGEVAMAKLLDLVLGKKRIERVTERIGAERVDIAQTEVDVFAALTLMEKIAGPKGVKSPDAGVVMSDGGTHQRVEANPNARLNEQDAVAADDPTHNEDAVGDEDDSLDAAEAEVAEAAAEAEAEAVSPGGKKKKRKKKSHWYEYKAGLCAALGPRTDGVAPGEDSPDPCPDVVEFLLNLEQMETLSGEFTRKAAKVAEPENDIDLILETEADLETILAAARLPLDESAAAAATKSTSGSQQRESSDGLPLSPKLTSRDVVATLEDRCHFGLKLAARAWHLGLFGAKFKAFVGDGSAWIWKVFDLHFKPFGFVPINDLLHAVSYLYSSAMAGRAVSEGGPVYQQWVRWLWSGEVGKVISELAVRQSELGLPEDDDGRTHPRRLVSDALTYLQNQKSRMNYPRYRKLGLPITSSHMESTVKELNYRLKGTEKFWSKSGGESVLQLKSDTISSSDPLSDYFATRAETRTGLRRSVGRHIRAGSPSA